MSVTVSQHKTRVGGDALAAVGGRTGGARTPSAGEVLAGVPRGTRADVDRAVEAPKTALPEWLGTTPQERSEALLKLAAAIDDNAEELAELESQNVGKPLGY